jgi:hypothetical protein
MSCRFFEASIAISLLACPAGLLHEPSHPQELEILSPNQFVLLLATPQINLLSYLNTRQGDGCVLTPLFSSSISYKTMDLSWKDASRHSERRRKFNVAELKRSAAAAVYQNVDEVARVEKLAQGGFNQTFPITMHDGFQLVGRILSPVPEPKYHIVAGEGAIMYVFRSQGTTVLKIYSYWAIGEPC